VRERDSIPIAAAVITYYKTFTTTESHTFSSFYPLHRYKFPAYTTNYTATVLPLVNLNPSLKNINIHF